VILSSVLVFIVGTAIKTNRYMQSVADFLAANRSAGRYLLCIASGIAGLGAISVVAKFEMFYEAGFTATWWMMIVTPIGLLLALSGWVTYRYRETRVMTLAQFFEVRYSKSFRIFAGIILWVSGIVNFGIFPAVGARFFIYFCGLPPSFTVLGLVIPMFPAVMLFLLSLSLLLVFIGGQIAVMITDFFQGMLTNVVFIIILVALFYVFDWSTICETLKMAPENASRIHPFRTDQVSGFNIWYFIIQAFVMVYGFRAWQGSQAYNFSARTAHEAKMAGILGEWRGLVMILLLMLLPIGAYVVMHNPDYAGIQANVTEALGRIENDAIRTQMTVPLALAEALPVGIVGLLAAVMLAAFVSTHDTYLHSWGAIFVQDVILPFRKKPFTPRQHLWLLRISILFVAVFIFVWSLLFRQTEYILMFFALTGAIWLGGAGAVIIGGLYWKRGSTAGAWAALSTGAVVGIAGIILQQVWAPHLYPWMAENARWLLDGLARVLEGIADLVWGINWKVEPDRFP
ncbi:MAG TPA: sodium:solute symporter, partial [Candidatus Hydrogenedentes bacterium]|nr:sodium:solute symporter [Candidatus Hydrogenedentota bacterium]